MSTIVSEFSGASPHADIPANIVLSPVSHADLDNYEPADAASAMPELTPDPDVMVQETPTYHVVCDRIRLERALVALEPPAGLTAGPLRLRLQRRSLLIETRWGDLRLSATIGLVTSRNNLPREGLTLEALQPFGALTPDGDLTLGQGERRSRRVELLIQPSAEQLNVTFGGQTHVSSMIPPSTSSVAARPMTEVSLRRALYRLQDASSNDATAEGAPHPLFTLDSGGLVSDAALDEHRAVPDLTLEALARVLAYPGDLLSRAPLTELASRADLSEMHCAFEMASSSEPTAFAGQLIGGAVAYLELGSDTARFIRDNAARSATGLVLTIWDRMAGPELRAIHQQVTTEPDAASDNLAAAAEAMSQVDPSLPVKLPPAATAWIAATLQAGDRLLLGLHRDGVVDILIARGSDAITFLQAPMSTAASAL